jgi:hypothetical protein
VEESVRPIWRNQVLQLVSMADWHTVCCTYRCTHASCPLLKLLVDEIQDEGYQLCSKADSIKIKRWILVQDYETIGVHVRIEGFFVVIMRRHALRLQHSLLMA